MAMPSSYLGQNSKRFGQVFGAIGRISRPVEKSEEAVEYDYQP